MVSGLGAYAIAAVGLCGQPKFVTLVPFFALNVALSALVARRKGQGNRDSANKILQFSLVFAACLVIVISTLGVKFADQFLRFAGSQPDTHPYAVEYFRIVVGGMAFNVFSLVINAAQRGAGNTMIAMGQCNDAYGAIQVAVALSQAFGCSVNELPLSFVLSWYEQKAVCILLTLLYLGIKNIVLGPSLPAFVSPAVLDFLVKQYGIAPTTNVKDDLDRLLKR